jgi:hypothetical protein
VAVWGNGRDLPTGGETMTLIYPIALGRTGMIGKPTDFPILPVGGAAFAGAFDAIANLVHVYCIARRWLTSYTGNLVRLRRASDNAELDFGYDVDGNLDTAAIATWAGGDSFIVTIYDQVSGDDVGQGTAGNQPLFVASGQNGHAIGRYNGTSHRLQGAFTNGGALSQPYTVYMCEQLNAASVGQGLPAMAIIDSDDTTNRINIRKNTTTDGWTIFAGASLNYATTVDGNFNLAAALINGASTEMWINGTSIGTGNPGAHNPDGLTIGARFDGAAQWWHGDLATIAIADPNHDTTAREATQTALDDYWDMIP